MNTKNTAKTECFIRITSSHIQYDTNKYERFGISPSLFDNSDNQEEFYPEDYADEMNAAIKEILKIEHSKFGSPLEMQSEDDDSDDLFDLSDDEADADLTPTEMLNNKLEKLLQLISSDHDADNDELVFETEGLIEKTSDNGCEVFEIRYREDESMDNTETVIRFIPSQPHSVVIIHEGGVVSNLICEEGKRHISVYETPIMPFEIAVYAKKCNGWITDKGGQISLDYILELRGADIQQTKMNIEIYVK